MSAETLVGYKYTNPEQSEPFAQFEVVGTAAATAKGANLNILAKSFQEVMYEAWVKQFAGQYIPQQIAESVNPNNEDFVDKQEEKLATAEKTGGVPAYVHARIQVPALITPGMSWYVAGIGKSAYADSRPGWLRRLKPEPPHQAKFADVSNIFVKPKLEATGYGLQGRGYAAGILRSLLDSFDDDMQTVVYDYEFNKRLQPLLKELGFNAFKSWDIPLFGVRVEQTLYKGLLKGDLVERLEAKKKWLKNREPVIV